MKVIKTANGNEIKLSKSEWQTIGKTAGWIKSASVNAEIWKGDSLMGKSLFSDEEARHFSSAPVSSAGVALSDSELKTMGLNAEDEINIVINEEGEEEAESEWETFSFGTTPDAVINERVISQTPNGYPMTIRSQSEWATIVKAVNQGIDAHLEGFTRSDFNDQTGEILIHPAEMTILLRRLFEDGDDEAWSLRSAILSTLNIEEI